MIGFIIGFFRLGWNGQYVEMEMFRLFRGQTTDTKKVFSEKIFQKEDL